MICQILLLFVGSVSSVSAVQFRHAIIEATVRVARFVELVSPSSDDDMPIGGYYDVVISAPKVLKGSMPPGLRKVRLIATHDNAFKRGDKISVFLRIDDEGRVSAEAWGQLRVVSCFYDGFWRFSSVDGEWDFVQQSKSVGERYCVFHDGGS